MPLSDWENRREGENVSKIFTEDSRRQILDDYFHIIHFINQLSAAYEEGAPGYRSLDELMALIEKKDEAAGKLREKYLQAITQKNISRCPFTGQILARRIDDYGIDGLWWDSVVPTRPEETLLPTFFAMDGALTLSEGKAENTPFLCRPGPDIPFVIPRFLDYTQVRAVISCINIGPHTAYPIVYYADPMLYDEVPVKDWGSDYYWEEESTILRLMNTEENTSPNSDEYDFELEPWIKKGKLLWIAPQDEDLTLHSHVSYCPYLDLPGSMRPKYIKDGEKWEDDEDEMWDGGYPWLASQSDREVPVVIEEIEKGEL